MAVHLGDDHVRAAVAADERDERADRPAAEDEDAVVALHRRASDVVGGDGERLHERGLVVAERVGHSEQARHVHRHVLPHATGQVDAEHLEAVAEVRRAHPAGPAGSADRERLDDDAVAGLEAAASRRLGDLAEGLVADDATLRHAVVEVALEDVEIGAADADALDA